MSAITDADLKLRYLGDYIYILLVINEDISVSEIFIKCYLSST